MNKNKKMKGNSANYKMYSKTQEKGKDQI